MSFSTDQNSFPSCEQLRPVRLLLDVVFLDVVFLVVAAGCMPWALARGSLHPFGAARFLSEGERRSREASGGKNRHEFRLNHQRRFNPGARYASVNPGGRIPFFG